MSQLLALEIGTMDDVRLARFFCRRATEARDALAKTQNEKQNTSNASRKKPVNPAYTVMTKEITKSNDELISEIRKRTAGLREFVGLNLRHMNAATDDATAVNKRQQRMPATANPTFNPL